MVHVEGKAGRCHGSHTPPVRRAGHLEEGRQGLRPHRRLRAAQDGRDGHDLVVDDCLDPGLRAHLAAEQVTCVVMEATSDYWKPFYYLLEDLPGVEVLLVNARHVKNLPGRKTDVADATWLAQLGAHGLVRGSFVPPEPIRALRDLTRDRTAITRERSREVQRLEKRLEARTPGSSCPRSPRTSWGSRAGRCWRR